MSFLDFFNRDLGAQDEYSGASREELVRKLADVQAEIAEHFSKAAGQRTTATGQMHNVQWLIDRQTKIQGEINKRGLRWKRERGPTWIVAFFIAIVAVSLIALLITHR